MQNDKDKILPDSHGVIKMKKIVILLIALVGFAGCSNSDLIECNTERQQLRLQVDELSQQIKDLNLTAYQDQTNAELKIGRLESDLSRTEKDLNAIKLRLGTELPELQKAYDAIKSQLEIANAAMREELSKGLASQKEIQELKDAVKKLNATIEQKEALLKEANIKLQELAEALKAKNEKEIKEDTVKTE